jgi:2-polyprenyl-3-methyl-5-hydroxy-6-metoxy-1,4-benzoquinol methylase
MENIEIRKNNYQTEAKQETNYASLATQHIEHAIRNRPYDNILFKKIIDRMGDISKQNILEYGCGHGHYANYLATC